MYILAFETSCDDTSIAIFKDDKLIAMDTDSQICIHNKTGGVVPEVAAREHANNIFKVLTNVLNQAKLTLGDIDYIGVTTNPGLLPSLLTGTTVAGTISTVLNKKIIPINHIEAHIFSNFLEREEKEIQFPLVCLTVSGGHNDIYHMKSMFDIEKLGSTGDDAGGEAFDKAAKMMGLGYPGGPVISRLAEEYEKEGGKSTNLFPRVWLVKREFNFSFSGLKSSIKREVDKRIKEKGELSLKDKKELSFEFENAITEVMAWKIVEAARQKGVKTIMLAGGVSANNKLKNEISKLAKKEKLKFIFPIKNLYCMDNAAMVGINAYYKIKYGNFEEKIGVVKM
ncbi:tRNA (adenosine(37)-N6)-threonylcarbamoyltransferase complex transferase subunit TsaD [Candidatus Gracilibacteria bacterium]|nr:tRNA (adenosine(37)-N6)-threonylcarbamoyltransferase complex transferase subunit TsaD [Candidatus Gracilibacteria bacterium]